MFRFSMPASIFEFFDMLRKLKTIQLLVTSGEDVFLVSKQQYFCSVFMGVGACKETDGSGVIKHEHLW